MFVLVHTTYKLEAAEGQLSTSLGFCCLPESPSELCHLLTHPHILHPPLLLRLCSWRRGLPGTARKSVITNGHCNGHELIILKIQ